MNQDEILRAALAQSALDCSCEPEDFFKKENVCFESKPCGGARKYLTLPHVLNLVSYGTNVVAAGKKELLPSIKAFMDGVQSVQRCFETPYIYLLNRLLKEENSEICFMAEYFLPDFARVFAYDGKCPFALKTLAQEDFQTLYTPEWSNALCEKRKELDMLGVGAFDGEKLIGLAACSADCDSMWQIGVDVLPEYRRMGVASAITNRLAREIFARGRVPFYCAAWSNVKSARNALKSGFLPAWVEATAKPIAYAEELMKNG